MNNSFLKVQMFIEIFKAIKYFIPGICENNLLQNKSALFFGLSCALAQRMHFPTGRISRFKNPRNACGSDRIIMFATVHLF